MNTITAKARNPKRLKPSNVHRDVAITAARPDITGSATFVLFDVPGDGSCLFHSVALGIEKHRSVLRHIAKEISSQLLRDKLAGLLNELSYAGRRESRSTRGWLMAALSLIDASDMECKSPTESDSVHEENILTVSQKRLKWQRDLIPIYFLDDASAFEEKSNGLRDYIRRYASYIAGQQWVNHFHWIYLC